MSFLVPAAIGAGGSILGSVLGGKSQQNAANSAEDAQQNMLNTQLQYLQNAGNQARGAIGGMLPYSQGASQAASLVKNNVPFLQPGQGATFGGQVVQSTPQGGQVDYRSLLSPNVSQQLSPNTATLGGGNNMSSTALAPPMQPGQNVLHQALQGMRSS